MTAAAAAEMPTELTTAEVSLLALSNPRRSGEDRKIAMTTKEYYLWAALLSAIAESELIIQPATLLDTIRQEFEAQDLKLAMPGELVTSTAGRSVFKGVAKRLLFPSPSDIDDWYEGVTTNANQTYQSLVKGGFIEDPFSIIAGGVAMVVLGLVPVSFTRLTQKGEQVLMRLKAAFWEYERSNKGGLETVDVRFRLFTLIGAFYAGARRGFAASWEQIQKEGGEGVQLSHLGP